MSFLTGIAVIKAVFGRLGAWLGSLNIWQLLLIAALLFAGLQTLRLKAEQRHAHKVEAQLLKCSGTQRKLQSESKAQQQQSGKVIEHYITVEKPVIRTEVQKIESAPLPGNCRSPKEVLGADV